MRYSDIKIDPEVNELIEKANANLGVLGFTDHSQAHVTLVAERAAELLGTLGYDEEFIELTKIAAFMHDIGNAINRSRHGEFGALLANEILKKYDLKIKDRIMITSAIANHDESTGVAVDAMSAALIIADKSDVRRNRVRNKSEANFDIHDRVNYAVTRSELITDTERALITLELSIDETICTMYEYFDIFLNRMLMCKKASEFLSLNFSLVVNGNRIL